jgi:hypothetical protein
MLTQRQQAVEQLDEMFAASRDSGSDNNESLVSASSCYIGGIVHDWSADTYPYIRAGYRYTYTTFSIKPYIAYDT